MTARTKNLAEIIRANPGCVAVVDNDSWWLYKKAPDYEQEDDPENELANDRNVIRVGRGYGSGCRYGGDLLQALAQIVGITIESV